MTTVETLPTTARHELSRPFIEHLHHVEAEAYYILEHISSPFQILKTFGPSKEQRAEKTQTFFSKIYYYLVGINQDIQVNIRDHQNKLIAKSHNLVDLCEELPIHENLKEEFYEQLAKVTQSQVKVLDYVQDINAMRCAVKLGVAALSTILSIVLAARIYSDCSYCYMRSAVEQEKAMFNAMCPSIFNPQYYISLVTTHVVAPFLLVSQVINRVKDHNFLNIFYDDPAEDSLDACKRLSLGSLMRISHIKNRILTLIQTS